MHKVTILIVIEGEDRAEKSQLLKVQRVIIISQ